MDKYVAMAGAKPIIDNHILDLKIQGEKHEISEPYDTEEIIACLRMEILNSKRSKDIEKIEGPQCFFEFVGERKVDIIDYVQKRELRINQDSLKIIKEFQGQKTVVDHNAILEGSHQCEETSSNPISWLEDVLTIIAGMLIGIILFGAFL